MVDLSMLMSPLPPEHLAILLVAWEHAGPLHVLSMALRLLKELPAFAGNTCPEAQIEIIYHMIFATSSYLLIPRAEDEA